MMGYLILREPETEDKPIAERRYALYCTYNDTFRSFNQTAAEIAEFFADMARSDQLRNIERYEKMSDEGMNMWGREKLPYYLTSHIASHCEDEEVNAEVSKRGGRHWTKGQEKDDE